MAVHKRVFAGVEIMAASQSGITNVALDDLAAVLVDGLAPNLEDIITSLDLTHEINECPLEVRGSVKMISLPGALALLAPFDAPVAREVETWLLSDVSDLDRERYEGLAPEDVRNLRLHDAITRILERIPDASPAVVAELLGIDEETAARGLGFNRFRKRLPGKD